MRYYISVSILILFFSLNCYGQDTTAQLNSSWNNLKTQLQRRTEIVINLTSVLTKANNVAKNEINNSKVIAIELTKFIDTIKTIDKNSVSLASKKNDKLTEVLTRALVALENDKKIWASDKFTDLIAQLEGSENRIALAKRDYNETCKSFNRLELIFGSGAIDKIPTVKF